MHSTSRQAPYTWRLLSDGTGRPWAARFGDTQIEIDTVQDVQLSLCEEPTSSGAAFCFAAFFIFAGIILIGVVDLGWRPRFLLGSAVLAAIGLMALGDAWAAAPLKLYRVSLTTADGEHRFSTVSEVEATAFLHAMRRATGQAAEA